MSQPDSPQKKRNADPLLSQDQKKSKIMNAIESVVSSQDGTETPTSDTKSSSPTTSPEKKVIIFCDACRTVTVNQFSLDSPLGCSNCTTKIIKKRV